MIIISGEDVLKSSQKLSLVCQEYQKKGVTVNTFDQSEITLGKLRQELSPTDLFGGTSALVIKGLLSGTKSKNKEKIIEFLKKENPQNLILYESKSVHPSTVKQFKGAINESFKVDINIFKFLDLVSPGNQIQIHLHYNDLRQKGVDVEYIFAMLVRQFRLLIQCRFSQKPPNINPYALRSLLPQSQKYNPKQLIDLYLQLCKIDILVKTGQSSLDTGTLLEHFLDQI